MGAPQQLSDLLGSLHWADEVIVAGGGSTDGTGAIARAQGATVLRRAGSTIAAQRNRAIAAARNAWVFALDADERVSDALVEELRWVLRDPPQPAYRVRRENFFLGRERRRGRWGRDWQVRLFTRERRFLPDRVHERGRQAASGLLLRAASYDRHTSGACQPLAAWRLSTALTAAGPDPGVAVSPALGQRDIVLDDQLGGEAGDLEPGKCLE